MMEKPERADPGDTELIQLESTVVDGGQAGTTKSLFESLNRSEQYERLWGEIYNADYLSDSTDKKTWKGQWTIVMNDTAGLMIPDQAEEIAKLPEAHSRLMILRAYAVLLCSTDLATRLRIMWQLIQLKQHPAKHIASAARHHLGRLYSLTVELPDLNDPTALQSGIDARQFSIDEFATIEDTQVPGDPMTLSGKADLPGSTLAVEYKDRVAPGAELPVNRIVKPKRLLGTALEAVAVLQMQIGQYEKAKTSLQQAVAFQREYLAEFGDSLDAFNRTNVELVLFECCNLLAHIRQNELATAGKDEETFTWETQAQDADRLMTSMNELQAAGKLKDWKRAEWDACIEAGRAKAATDPNVIRESVAAMLAKLTLYVESRLIGDGGPAKAKEVIRHDCLFASVIYNHGTDEQKDAFAELLKPEEV